MGCNGSKNADINTSRQRVKQPPTTSSSPPPSSSKNPESISSPPLSTGKKAQVDDQQAAESFTDLRIRENEMFQKIINKTAHNFIDIAQSPGMMQQHHMMSEHFHHYDSFDSRESPSKQNQPSHHTPHHHHANQSTQPEQEVLLNEGVNNRVLFGLPTASSAKLDPMNELKKTSATEDDLHMILRIADVMIVARDSMRINDENIPPLVVQLPEIDDV